MQQLPAKGIKGKTDSIALRGHRMFKKYMALPIMLFVTLTIKQLIFNSEISWTDNIVHSVLFSLFYYFWEWIMKTYDWDKHKKGE